MKTSLIMPTTEEMELLGSKASTLQLASLPPSMERHAVKRARKAQEVPSSSGPDSVLESLLPASLADELMKFEAEVVEDGECDWEFDADLFESAWTRFLRRASRRLRRKSKAEATAVARTSSMPLPIPCPAKKA